MNATRCPACGEPYRRATRLFDDVPGSNDKARVIHDNERTCIVAWSKVRLDFMRASKGDERG